MCLLEKISDWTAAEIGLGNEIVTNWEEKCLLPHYIWLCAWSRVSPVASVFNVCQFNSCQLWADRLSEEMRNPVSVFVLLGIVLAGAALGYWIVRKFVITEDGSVDGGIAQFVKWSMRIMAAAFILQSTLDTPLAMGTLASCFAISFLLTSLKWNSPDAIIIFGNSMYSGYGSPWRTGGQASARQNRAEFLSRSGKVGPRRTLWNSPRRSPTWFDSPVKGVISPSTGTLLTRPQRDHYSTFHKTPNRKKISKKEWENFTKEATREAMADLASSPEFTDWIIKHADRIQLLPEGSSDEAIGSGSDSTDDNVAESCNRFGFFKW